MKSLQIGMNCKVKVKLSEFGMGLVTGNHLQPGRKIDLDDDGYYNTELWCLFNEICTFATGKFSAGEKGNPLASDIIVNVSDDV